MTALIIPLSSSSAPPEAAASGHEAAVGREARQTLPGDLPHPEHPIYYPLPPGAPVDPEYGIPEGACPDQGLTRLAAEA